MKDTLSVNWSVAQLGDICRIELGSTPARKDPAMWDTARVTSNAWLSIADMPRALHADATDSKEYVSDLAAAKMRLVPKGTLLVSFKLTLGRLAYAGRDIFTNEAIASLLDINERQISKRYLYWALTNFDWEKAAEGDQKIKGKALNKEKLKRIPIPLPPLEEQQRIVALLDEALESLARARANAETNLRNARELFAINFEHELLRCRGASQATTLGEICTGFEYGTSAKSQPSGRMPVLRMGNLQSGEIDWGDLVYSYVDSDIRKLVLNEGDILVNRTNSLEHVGKAAIYRGDMPAIFAGYLIRLHFDRGIVLPEFLNLFLNSEGARAYGRSIAGKSVNQANISASKLKTYPMHLPPIDVQENIVRRVESLRQPVADIVKSYAVKLQDIDDLGQSLLQKAFAGELT